MRFSGRRYNAIQMIGTQRSGSNLLRLMLNQLPEVFAPHPPHVLLNFYPLLESYEPLTSEENFRKLADDVCSYIEANPVKWQTNHIDRNAVLSRLPNRTLLELFIDIHELQCDLLGKTWWCCKSLETIYHIDHFAKENFNPFIIYLERDGRDVAASFRKVMVGEKHIYNLAKKWKKDQELSLRYIDTLEEGHYHILKYEELISKPDECVKEICAKTGIAYSDEVMHYYESDESKRTAESGAMWSNVSKPILKDNTRNFLKTFSEDEILIFESVAGDTLTQLGYKLYTNESDHLTFTDDQIASFNEENEIMKVKAIKDASEDDKQKRKAQLQIIAEIKSRHNEKIKVL